MCDGAKAGLPRKAVVVLSFPLAWTLGCAAAQGPTLGPTDKAEIIQAVAAVKTDVAATVEAQITTTMKAAVADLSKEFHAGRDVNHFDKWAPRVALGLFALVLVALIGYVVYDRWADRRNGRRRTPELPSTTGKL